MTTRTCRHCGSDIGIRRLSYHERVCSQTPATIEAVAWAMEHDEPPANVVAARLGVSLGAAKMRVHRLKEAGLIASDARARRSKEIPHGTPSGYRYHRCKCDECRAWNAGKGREERARKAPPSPTRSDGQVKRPPRPRSLCICDDCGFTADTATRMHEHCLEQHGRKLTDAERTPRQPEAA